MFGNNKTRRRPRHATSEQYEFVAPAGGRLTFAAADRSDEVHLAVADVGQAWTMCALRLSRQPSTGRFHESGCWICASIAVSTGHTVVDDDKGGGLLRLREWLVADRLRETRQTIERPFTP